jgi:phospholipid/cholesterol/gamma-HCH transport system substrate-binding protein
VTRRRWASGLVVAMAVCLGGCGFHGISLQSLPKLGGVTGATYPIYATFGNVLNLPVEGQVRVGPQVVGEITSISAMNYQATVTMRIEKKVTLLKGTTAQVRFDNPLGDEYVLLTAPANTQAPALHSGAQIPESDTSTAPSVEDTLGALSLVLNGGGINQLQTIIHELNDAFNGNQPQIRSFLDTVNTAVTTLADGRTALDDFLGSAGTLTRELNGTGGAGAKTIGNGIASISPAIGVLTSENSSLDHLMAALSNLGSVGTQIEQQSGQNSVDDVRDLLPVVDQLNSVSQQLAPVLSDVSRFEAEAPRVAPGDYLQVRVVANVILPSGDFAPTVDPSDSATGSGSRAISLLLDGGLL